MNRLKFFAICLFLATLITSPLSLAQLYKWVDEQGNVHYGDSPPENANLKRITGKVSSFSSFDVEPFEFDENLLTTTTKTRTVIMYSTSWCGYCKQAAQHFRKNNIPFREYDIEKSDKAAREFKKLKGRGVPIILIGKQRMNGFDAKAFDRIYFDS